MHTHTDMEHHDVHQVPGGVGHEQSEVDVRVIVVSLIALLIGAFLVCLLVIGIFRFFHATYVSPTWSQTHERITQIGDTVFYR